MRSARENYRWQLAATHCLQHRHWPLTVRADNRSPISLPGGAIVLLQCVGVNFFQHALLHVYLEIFQDHLHPVCDKSSTEGRRGGGEEGRRERARGKSTYRKRGAVQGSQASVARRHTKNTEIQDRAVFSFTKRHATRTDQDDRSRA